MHRIVNTVSSKSKKSNSREIFKGLMLAVLLAIAAFVVFVGLVLISLSIYGFYEGDGAIFMQVSVGIEFLLFISIALRILKKNLKDRRDFSLSFAFFGLAALIIFAVLYSNY